MDLIVLVFVFYFGMEFFVGFGVCVQMMSVIELMVVIKVQVILFVVIFEIRCVLYMLVY